ncbi:MAG: hypothetical protein Q7L55_10360 [Actinomycetota bacterium]|nr:hypothetical protein [Actinomycetota bacterium]
MTTENDLPRNAEIIASMLRANQLESVPVSIQLATELIDKANGRLRSVVRSLDADDLGECASPLWDAIRLSLSSVLQAQGLRAGGAKGHHLNVLEAIEAQYGHHPEIGPQMARVRRIRSDRNKDEYPARLGEDTADKADLTESLRVAHELLATSERIAMKIAPFDRSV